MPSTDEAPSGQATDLLLELVSGLRWRELLDLELPLAPQPKQRARAARTPAPSKGRAPRRGGHGWGLDERRTTDDPYALGRAPTRRSEERVIVFTPKETRAWTAKAAVILGAHFRAAGHAQPHRHRPVRVDTVFFFDPPASPLHAIFPVVRPDRDNLDKIVLDALVQADVLADDAQVVAGAPLKLYAAPGTSPRVRVRLSVLED